MWGFLGIYKKGLVEFGELIKRRGILSDGVKFKKVLSVFFWVLWILRLRLRMTMDCHAKTRLRSFLLAMTGWWRCSRFANAGLASKWRNDKLAGVTCRNGTKRRGI